MSKLIKVSDGFAKDENGKIHIIPMRSLQDATSPISGNRFSTRGYIKHKLTPLQPLSELVWASPDENHTKKRKIDKSERTVRKELFKVPEKVKRLPSNKRSSLKTAKFGKSQPVQKTSIQIPKLIGTKYDSPKTLHLDKTEANQASSFSKNKLHKAVLFPIVEEKSRKTPNKDIKTPKSSNSDSSHCEFLQLEEHLASAKQSTTPSPLNSVCSLLEKTKITNSGKKDSFKSDVLSLIRKDSEEFELVKQSLDAFNQMFARFQDEHAKRMSRIFHLLSEDESKENVQRKSNRLAEKAKAIVSPAIVKKVDLRKTTLNKNLSKTFYDSPRTRSAVSMYNSFRSDCPLLCTPKMERTDSPTAIRSLSKRIQNQCLLLQDTPKP